MTNDPLADRAFLETWVECDECHRPLGGPEGDDQLSEAAIDLWSYRFAMEAREQGWRIDDESRIWCPDCPATRAARNLVFIEATTRPE